MVIFVYEYICGGGMVAQDLDQSMLLEGFTMLASIVSDLNSLQDTHVVTAIDQRFAGDPRFAEAALPARIHLVNPATEQQVFTELCRAADLCLIIAPESDGVLLERSRLADASCERRIGCSLAAIELTADKLATAGRLKQSDVSVIDGIVVHPADGLTACPSFPAVLKPRDGAGAQQTYLIESPHDLVRVCHRACDNGLQRNALLQPYIIGESVSVSCLVGPGLLVPLPACRQTLSVDGMISYRGGSGPLCAELQPRAKKLASHAVAAIPGLLGYVGVDLILAADPQEDVVVEINPRLTTSYVALRALSSSNLARCMLSIVAGQSCPPVFPIGQYLSFYASQGRFIISRERNTK